jgi:hypothetical protein
MPPVTVQWLPTAADVLEALTALGFKQQQQQQQQQQQGGEKGDKGQQQQVAAGSSGAFRHANLPLLLRLLGRVARGCAAGRLEGGGGLVSSPGQYQQLLLALLSLMLDPRAAQMCR